jgi:hypothetical protein
MIRRPARTRASATSASCAARSISKVLRLRALIPIGVVSLDERIEACGRRLVHEPARRRVVEVAQKEEQGVGAGLPGERDVVATAEEPLGEKGHVGCRTSGSQIGPAAAEALGIDEYRDGGRTGVGVGER